MDEVVAAADAVAAKAMIRGVGRVIAVAAAFGCRIELNRGYEEAEEYRRAIEIPSRVYVV